MKRDLKITFCVTIGVIVWLILFAKHASAEPVTHEGWDYFIYEVLNLDEVELIYPNTFTSDHRDQCDPWCAQQNNGGHGARIGRFGFISLMNSYGDPGKVLYFEPVRFEYNYEMFRPGFAIWIMQIEGYKSEECAVYIKMDDGRYHCDETKKEPITVGPFPWAVAQFALSPGKITEKITGWRLFKNGDNVWLKYNIIHFPVVRIQWWSIEVNYTF